MFVVFQAALAARRVAATVPYGNGDHHRRLFSAIRLSSTVNNSRSGPGSYDERRLGAGNLPEAPPILPSSIRSRFGSPDWSAKSAAFSPLSTISLGSSCATLLPKHTRSICSTCYSTGARRLLRARSLLILCGEPRLHGARDTLSELAHCA